MVIEFLSFCIVAFILQYLAAVLLIALLHLIYTVAVLMIRLAAFVIANVLSIIFYAAIIMAVYIIAVVTVAIVLNLAAIVMANLPIIILGAKMVAAGVIIGAVMVASVVSLVAMMVATAQFIGNIPTYVRHIYSAVAQAAINAADFFASFFRTQASEPVVATLIPERERSTLPIADACYVLNSDCQSETLSRGSLTFFNLPASAPLLHLPDPDTSSTSEWGRRV